MLKQFNCQSLSVKVWRNWPTLLAKHYCFRLKSGVTSFTMANDSETNNSVCQAMLVNAKSNVIKLDALVIMDGDVHKLTCPQQLENKEFYEEIKENTTNSYQEK